MYQEDKSSLCMNKVDKDGHPSSRIFSRHINMQISKVIGIKNILFILILVDDVSLYITQMLKVIWIQYNANIIAFEHVFRWGLNKRIQTYGNPM